MIKECILAKTGIQFDMDYLRDDLDFDFDDLVTEMKKKGMQIANLCDAYGEIENYTQDSSVAKAEAGSQSTVANDSPQTHNHVFRRYFHDVFDQIFDQLVLAWWFWWILEILPLRSTYQDLQGNWIRLRR